MQSKHRKFTGHIRNINHTRKKAELLFTKGLIVERDIKLIYSGLFIELVTSFENHIEALFTGLLCQKLHSTSAIIPIITFPSQKICFDIICGDRNYVDWLPYDSTISRSKRYFKDDKEPFTKLSSHYKNLLRKIVTLRHCIAHNSTYSYTKFKKNILQETSHLSRKEMTPIGFLRGFHNANTTRYEYFAASLIGASQEITS